MQTPGNSAVHQALTLSVRCFLLSLISQKLEKSGCPQKDSYKKIESCTILLIISSVKYIKSNPKIFLRNDMNAVCAPNKTTYKLRTEDPSNKCAVTDISISSTVGAGVTRTARNTVGK
jgi:hypothetical protein